VSRFEFRPNFWHQKTRVPGLSCGVVCVILRLAVLTTVPACDERTVRQTQDDSIYRASIASRGKNGHNDSFGKLACLSQKGVNTNTIKQRLDLILSKILQRLTSGQSFTSECKTGNADSDFQLVQAPSLVAYMPITLKNHSKLLSCLHFVTA